MISQWYLVWQSEQKLRRWKWAVEYFCCMLNVRLYRVLVLYLTCLPGYLVGRDPGIFHE